MAKSSEPPLIGAVDPAGPWTIKNCSTATRLAVTEAARKEGVTVGAWLERRVREWLDEGSPVRVATGSHPRSETGDDLGKLTAAFQALAAAGLPIAKGHANRLTGALLDRAGLVPRPSRLPAPAQLALASPAEPELEELATTPPPTPKVRGRKRSA